MGLVLTRAAVFRVAALVLLLIAPIACGSQAASNATPAIGLDPPTDANPRAAVTLTGLSPDEWQRLTARALTRDRWTQILRVSVGPEQPAIVGEYAVASETIRFTPMFPLDPGRQYHVVFDRNAIPGNAPAGNPLIATVGLPARRLDPSTVVSHIYPSSTVVPENQLRLYVHFSAPMGLKGGLDYIRLLDDRGQQVVDPFLPLDMEFWNGDRTRYTVFFDPGRQKRGITPNQQMGRSLEPGRRYTLVIDRQWRDGNGLPLKDTFTHEFSVTAADERPLETKTWVISSPRAETRDAVVVMFPEPLDHGLLQRALGIAAPDGRPVDGDVRIDNSETRWSFTPREPWRAGTSQLVVLGFLEDLAGNRIGRAFEVDRFDRSDATREPERMLIPFRVGN